jgi:His/Glu/Gln/Arg/opine family amino acid ABC transporter permease subunit
MDWTLFAYGANGWGDELVRGLGVTVAVAVLAYAIGLILGTMFGLLERGSGLILPRLLGGYAAIIRSLPELLVIFSVYFGFAFAVEAIFSWCGIEIVLSISPFAAGVGALAIVQGAYTSEVVKGAVNGVPSELVGAARSLGLSQLQTLRHVTIPLALRNAFPGLANLWMVVIKNTPFVSAIQLEDFIAAAGTAGENTKHYFAFYGMVLAVYLLISGLSIFVISRLEGRLMRCEPRLPA